MNTDILTPNWDEPLIDVDFKNKPMYTPEEFFDALEEELTRLESQELVPAV